jgi:hypothetical protein
VITRVGVLQFFGAVVQYSAGALDRAFADVKKPARLFLGWHVGQLAYLTLTNPWRREPCRHHCAEIRQDVAAAS